MIDIFETRVVQNGFPLYYVTRPTQATRATPATPFALIRVIHDNEGDLDSIEVRDCSPDFEVFDAPERAQIENVHDESFENYLNGEWSRFPLTTH